MRLFWSAWKEKTWHGEDEAYLGEEGEVVVLLGVAQPGDSGLDVEPGVLGERGADGVEHLGRPKEGDFGGLGVEHRRFILIERDRVSN